MIRILLLDTKTRKQFWKEFPSMEKARAFCIRCNYGKKLKVLDIVGWETTEDYFYILGK